MAESSESSGSLYNTSSPAFDAPLRSLLDDLRPSPFSSSSSHSTTSTPSIPSTPSLPITSEKRVHIANIPYKWQEVDLRTLFAPYGETKQVEIVCNERGSKGFGFATFLDAEAADLAIVSLTGMEFNGRKIEVSEATRRIRPYSDRRPNTRKTTRNTHHNSSDFSALLQQQKQLLAQQQLQQLILAQQQSDLMASALGLPTSSNLGGFLMGGQLPYPHPMPGLTIDPRTLQLQSLPLLHQSLLPTQQQLFGQLATVPTGYTVPPAYNMANIKTDMTTESVPKYSANEMTGLSSTTKNRSSTLRNDSAPSRFTPY